MSWKLKKIVPQKIASRINKKNDIFQKNKDQNQKLRAPMNCKHTTHKALKTQKYVAVYFKDVKIEEIFSSQEQKLVKTTNLWRQTFSDIKTTTAKILFCNDR